MSSALAVVVCSSTDLLTCTCKYTSTRRCVVCRRVGSDGRKDEYTVHVKHDSTLASMEQERADGQNVGPMEMAVGDGDGKRAYECLCATDHRGCAGGVRQKE